MEKIVNISYKHKLSHLSSCITIYPILSFIYKNKKENDIVILSCGHAGLAQYVVIDEYSNGEISAESMLLQMGIHPIRDVNRGIYVSSGSLGSACLIAVGYAIASPLRDIYCVLSDGECAEGSVWEAFAICYKLRLTNLHFHVNINGFSAYDAVDRVYLEKRLLTFCPWITVHQTKNPEKIGDGGISTHYTVLREIPPEISDILSTQTPTYGHLYNITPIELFEYKTPTFTSNISEDTSDMRKKFAVFLLEEMAKNEKIFIITADIGFGVLDKIRTDFPNRFLNVGSCENLMIGIAIGLYYSGFIPICYTITPFLLYRPFEMIRNYINYEKLPIKMVGSGRDRDYSHDGFTHWSEDDVAILGCAFPNIHAYKPNTPDFTREYLREILYNKCPCYLNLTRGV